MNRNLTERTISDLTVALAAECPKNALQLITGIFVGLLELNVEEAGGDKSREIKIEGGTRIITVSADQKIDDVQGGNDGTKAP